jgi:hypothetical protein
VPDVFMGRMKNDVPRQKSTEYAAGRSKKVAVYGIHKSSRRSSCLSLGGGPYNSREPGLVIRLEARGGIEPPNKPLQTLPFSFWVPRQM